MVRVRFRRVLALASIGDQEDLNSRYRLAEMLFDLERPLDAAKTWQELVDRLDSDPMVRERFGNASSSSARGCTIFTHIITWPAENSISGTTSTREYATIRTTPTS